MAASRYIKRKSFDHNLSKVEDCQGKLYVEGISIVPGVSIGAEIPGPLLGYV